MNEFIWFLSKLSYVIAMILGYWLVFAMGWHIWQWIKKAFYKIKEWVI